MEISFLLQQKKDSSVRVLRIGVPELPFLSIVK